MTPPLLDPRPSCPRCRRPLTVCWCQDLPILQTRTHVLFLQHPRESRVAIGTARMAHLCLPNSELHIGLDFGRNAVVARALSDPERPAALLFPAPDAPDILLNPPDGPLTLVVVDGTWSQARKLVRYNPFLAALPRYAFQPPATSIYQIRREPHEDCVSTIEALVFVLGALEGDPTLALAMLDPFRKMIAFQVERAETTQQPRSRIRCRPLAEPPPVPAWMTRRDDLVLISGEANAWPRQPPPPFPDELIHWVAVRPATGEFFEAVVAPRNALSPTTPIYTELPAKDLLAGESWEGFLARWHAFLRPSDVLGSWGTHFSGLLERGGGQLPVTRVDFREVARKVLNCRFGNLEAWRVTLSGQPEPMGRGRAGLRLGMLADLVNLPELQNGPALGH